MQQTSDSVPARRGFRMLHARYSTIKGIPDDALNQYNLVIVQFVEFALAALLRKCAVVLPDESDEVFRQPIGHLDRVHDPSDRFVVVPEIVDLARKIFFHRAPYACKEKFCGLSAIKVPVEVGG